MKYYQLDEEEKQLLEEFQKGEWISVKDFVARKKALMQMAKNTSNKTKNINIRISEKDLYKIKVKAAQEGIPYQTKIASIIHQNVN